MLKHVLPKKVCCGIQHYLSPLHLYCRLKEIGLKQEKARRWCLKYEWLYKLLL